MHYRGLLYRALNPLWAREPLSGEGARRHGGRFNRRGVPALYLSFSIPTAIREANQVGTLQPTTLVAYEADVGPLLDASAPAALAPYGMTSADLAANDWRIRMRDEGAAPTQHLADRLTAEGFAGMRVPSYARGAGEGDLNAVLWRWEGMLRVVDDEGRLR